MLRISIGSGILLRDAELTSHLASYCLLFRGLGTCPIRHPARSTTAFSCVDRLLARPWHQLDYEHMYGASISAIAPDAWQLGRSDRWSCLCTFRWSQLGLCLINSTYVHIANTNSMEDVKIKAKLIYHIPCFQRNARVGGAERARPL